MSSTTCNNTSTGVAGAPLTTRNSAKKRKAKDVIVVKNEREEILYGALEIVAVYTGGEEVDNNDSSSSSSVDGTNKDDDDQDQKKPYDFVTLTNDVMKGDTENELIMVQWLEYNDKGNLEMLDLDTHEISIGAIITSATIDVVELSDGTYEVPKALHDRVKAKLEKQLADESDEGGDQMEDDGEPTYEMRMRKMKRNKVKNEPDNRKKKKIVKEEDDEVEEDGSPAKKSKSQKKATKKTKAKLVQRDDIKLVDNPWTQKTGKLNPFKGDTHRASKEVIRAYLSKDTAVFTKIIKNDEVIADLFVEQSCDVNTNVLDYAFIAEDKNTLKTLIKDVPKMNISRPSFPECTLLQLTSGQHTSNYADYNRYNVGASRGSIEGNNAFTSDMSGHSYKKVDGGLKSLSPNQIIELLCTNDSVSMEFIDYVDKEFFNNNLISWGLDFHKLIVYGHQEFAQKVMTVMLERGVGLNQLHIDCLGKGHTIEKILPVSIEKMTAKGRYVRFCPIHCAAYNGNPTYLKQLLEAKPSAINSLDSNEANLVHYAAVGDTPSTLKWLLEGPGVSLNRNAKMRKCEKSTPLMWAVQAARAENVRVLCEGQSDDMFTIKDVSGQCAFHYVAYSSRTARFDTARALIECGANPNIPGDARLLNKQTPVMICAARGDLELLKILVEGGGDLTVVDKLGRTPLMFATKNGHAHIVSYCLQMGVDADDRDSSDNTAVHYAAAYGWIDCLDLLHEAGANLDSKNIWSSTPLELALKKGRFACAVILLKEEVDVNVRDKNGVSLFNSLVSSYIGQLSENKKAPLPWAINQIIKRDELDVACVDSSDQTVLHHIAKGHAEESDILELVDKLLTLGVDPLKKNKASKCAAEIAFRKNNMKLCLKLLQHSSHADLHETGENLLHLLMTNITNCEESIFMEIFSLLHKSNNNWIKNIDDDGRQPLLLAAENVRKNWDPKGKGKTVLEKLFDVLIERLGDERGRRSWLQNWSDNLVRDGELVWDSSYNEYKAGSRTVLHEILRCPDVSWALKMTTKILGNTTDTNTRLLNLKTNGGKDAIAYALDTFVNSKAPVDETIKLFQLLCENGAIMNSVNHYHFSSLEEAESDLPKVDFNAMDCSIDDASKYVHYLEKLSVKEILNDEKKRLSLEDEFVPRLFQILNLHPSPELLKGLLEKCRLSSNIKDMAGNTALHCTKDLELVKELIPHSDINATNNEGETPLMLAVGNPDLVNFFISNEADVNIVSSKGSVLHAAVKIGQTGVVEKLVEVETCDVDISDEIGRSALHYAVALRAISEKQDLNPIENQLLLAGANVNKEDNFGRTPLHYCFFPINVNPMITFPPAPVRDPIDMVTLLSGKPVDFAKADKMMRTPLHYAAATGSVICAMYICENSQESVHSMDLDNNTPLALALLAERADLATLLISRESELNINIHNVKRRKKKDDGTIKEIKRETQSALWFALTSNGTQSVARYMLAAHKISMGKIISSLVSTGNFRLATDQLKLCGVREKVLEPDKETGMTGLHYLAQVENFGTAHSFGPALTDEIIGHGISIDARNKEGSTAIHKASFRGHVDLCRHFVLTHNADVDIKDNKNRSVLARMLEGNNSSAELLCVLANASKDANALVNSPVLIDFSLEAEEKKWKSLENLDEFLLKNPNDNQQSHAEEVFIQKLLKDKTKVKEMDEDERKEDAKRAIASTPLIKAVLKNDKELVNTLLSFGADVTNVDENGRTAIHHAVISGNSMILHLLLNWDCSAINTIDKYGHSALSYNLLTLQNDGDSRLEVLLNNGVDTMAGAGKALEIAIKINKGQSFVKRMLTVAQRVISTNKKTTRKKLKKDDIVWVRYHDGASSWDLVTVSSVKGANVHVRRKIIGEKETSSNAEKQRFETITIHKSNTGIVTAKEDDDVISAKSVESLLFPLISDTQLSEEQKRKLIQDYKGYEIGLQDKLKDCPQKEALLSKLSIGDCVGYVIHADSTALCVGEVAAIHPNGQYGVKLHNGRHFENIGRIHLRPLRKELQISTKSRVINLNGSLVQACVKPVDYGSFEDLELLKTLIDAGAPVDVKDENGKTPLDLARPESEIQKFLQEVTKSKQGRSLPKTQVPSSDDGINFEADAGIEYAAILANRDEMSEKIIPPVSSVCELDSDGICVLADGDDFFDATLSKVDVEHGQYGKFVFYQIQVLFDPVRGMWLLLTNWGCIKEKGGYTRPTRRRGGGRGKGGKGLGKGGSRRRKPLGRRKPGLSTNCTSSGGGGGKYQQTPFKNKEDCTKEFKKVFKSKTGNDWDKRSSSFHRKSGKYVLVQKPKARMKDPEKLLKSVLVKSSPSHACSLPPPVTSMINSLLDPKELNLVYSRLHEIDSVQLPFGELSLSTIHAARGKLSEISDKLRLKDEILKRGGSVEEVLQIYEAIAKGTNEFLELLPNHNQLVKPFDKEGIEEAMKLTQQLLEMSITKSLLLGALHRQSTMNPIDYVYNAVGVAIKPLDIGSMERRCLMHYVDNTCTDSYVLVHQIYALSDGRVACDIPNKKLLFHGSKNENILGILKHGLLIAPPEAPKSGFRFGKGFYFSDQFDKAFKYSGFGDSSQPRAFVFVAEVALGESHIASDSEYMETARDGTHSTLGMGHKTPNESRDLILDAAGATIPLGNLKDSSLSMKESPQFIWEEYGSGIDDETNAKIEEVRVNPSTKFPVTIRTTTTHSSIKKAVTLLSPESDKIIVKRLKKKKIVRGMVDVNEIDDNMDEKEDENGEEDENFEEDNENVTFWHRRNKNVRATRNENEFVVYDTKQVRLKYLIEVTTTRWVERQFKKNSIS